jgi:putative redox protein
MKYKIDYEGSLRTKIEHLESHSVIFTDAPKDNQGMGEAFSPTDLFAVSIASCMMTLMGIAAKKLHIDLKDATMDVEKTMATFPRRIGQVSIFFRCSQVVTEEQRRLLENAAHECPVKKSLHPDIHIETSFIWGNA